MYNIAPYVPLESEAGIEPAINCLEGRGHATWRHRHGAISEVRTRSLFLGKEMRCQLRHYRVVGEKGFEPLILAYEASALDH